MAQSTNPYGTNPKIPTFIPILSGRLPGTTVFNRKIVSNVEYQNGDKVEFGTLVITQDPLPVPNSRWGAREKKYGAFKRARGRFSITTGKLVEKDDGKKYYEVYPELYEHEQACIISSALQMIKQSEKTNPSDSNALFTS